MIEGSPSRASPMLHIKHGVQRWVVIHLELAVLLEPALPREHLLPKPIQALHQVIALFNQYLVALPVALGMAWRSVEAIDLLGGVKELERQNGQPVDNQPRSLGVKLRLRIRKTIPLQKVQQDRIAKL